MEYKKSVLTQFAKDCAQGAGQMMNGICMAEKLSKDEIGYKLSNGQDEELLLEVAKRFAKYVKEQCSFDVECGEVQDFQEIIRNIVECCEEHDWFGN